MKWIKASERLPEQRRDYNCKFDGYPVSILIDVKNMIIENGAGYSYSKEEIKLIEWLDESPSPEPVQGENDMDAKEFFTNLFNLDFMNEEEKETIFKGAELFALGKVKRFKEQSERLKSAHQLNALPSNDIISERVDTVPVNDVKDINVGHMVEGEVTAEKVLSNYSKDHQDGRTYSNTDVIAAMEEYATLKVVASQQHNSTQVSSADHNTGEGEKVSPICFLSKKGILGDRKIEMSYNKLLSLLSEFLNANLPQPPQQ